MTSDISELTVMRDGYPLLRMFACFPIACFTCALLTDTAYAWTANIMWANFSAWLLAAGMAGGVLATIVGVMGWLTNRRRQTTRRAWVIMLGGALTLVFALLNNFMHSRDAWTSVMPMGLALSGVTVLVMLATAWLASGTSHRRSAAVPYSGVRQ